MTKTLLRARITHLALALALFASLASAQSLTTTFTTNNGQSGNMFDVKTVASAVIINDFDINIDTGITANIDVWAVTGGGTMLGVENNPAAWTLLGTATGVVSAGTDVPTNLGLSLGYIIPPVSTQGFYITVTSGTGMNYVTAPGAFQTIAASDSFLEIYHGFGKALSGYPTTFGSNFGGPTPGVSAARTWSGTIYYTPQSGLADDLALTSVSAPIDSVACEFLSATETVTATFTNFGSNTVFTGSLVQLDLTVDGGFVTSEFVLLPADLMLGQSYTHTFTATANCAAAGAHTIDVTVVYAGDLDPANDTKSIVVNSGNPNTITSYPWFEDFETAPTVNGLVPPTGWSQDQTDGTGTYSDWYFEVGLTSSLNTGPNGDHTTGGGFYAYTEDSGNFAQTNLDTPCLDLATLVNPTLSFWLHSHNNTVPATTNQNFISVDVITYPGGTVTMDLLGPLGDSGAPDWASSTWNQHSVNLSAFAGQLIQLRFRSRTDGGGFNHDIAIDDVAVFEPVATPGQAPRPGLAVFDIENALNGNLQSVSSGAGGPYYTNVTQGSSFNFHFEGEASQPIAVVYGALNPVSATYPGGIGQFDIGGPGVDPQGIPLNIGVFVNAIAWASNPVGFPLDALFFTNGTGTADIGFQMPNFGIPGGTVLTTFQSAITSAAAPFVYISNAIEVTIN